MFSYKILVYFGHSILDYCLYIYWLMLQLLPPFVVFQIYTTLTALPVIRVKAAIKGWWDESIQQEERPLTLKYHSKYLCM